MLSTTQTATADSEHSISYSLEIQDSGQTLVHEMHQFLQTHASTNQSQRKSIQQGVTLFWDRYHRFAGINVPRSLYPLLLRCTIRAKSPEINLKHIKMLVNEMLKITDINMAITRPEWRLAVCALATCAGNKYHYAIMAVDNWNNIQNNSEMTNSRACTPSEYLFEDLLDYYAERKLATASRLVVSHIFHCHRNEIPQSLILYILQSLGRLGDAVFALHIYNQYLAHGKTYNRQIVWQMLGIIENGGNIRPVMDKVTTQYEDHTQHTNTRQHLIPRAQLNTLYNLERAHQLADGAAKLTVAEIKQFIASIDLDKQDGQTLDRLMNMCCHTRSLSLAHSIWAASKNLVVAEYTKPTCTSKHNFIPQKFEKTSTHDTVRISVAGVNGAYSTVFTASTCPLSPPSLALRLGYMSVLIGAKEDMLLDTVFRKIPTYLCGGFEDRRDASRTLARKSNCAPSSIPVSLVSSKHIIKATPEHYSHFLALLAYHSRGLLVVKYLNLFATSRVPLTRTVSSYLLKKVANETDGVAGAGRRGTFGRWQLRLPIHVRTYLKHFVH